jgi:membrane protease YdiL (CAAX protease family)
MSNDVGFFGGALWKSALFPIIRLFLALLFVIIPVGLIQVLVKSLSGPHDGSVLFTCLAVPAAFFAYWGYVRLVEKRSPAEIALTGAPMELGRGLLAGIALFTTTIGILWILGFYHVTGSNGWIVLVDSLTLAVMSGFLEELLTRGIIFRIMEETLGTWIALALSALLFGSMHLGNPHATIFSASAIALEAGLLLGACYILTRRLWLAIGLHLAWNFTQGGIFGVAVSGTTAKGILQSNLIGPEILSGGAFGAEASIIAVIVCVTGFVFVILRARKKGQIIRPFWLRSNDLQAT